MPSWYEIFGKYPDTSLIIQKTLQFTNRISRYDMDFVENIQICIPQTKFKYKYLYVSIQLSHHLPVDTSVKTEAVKSYGV